jgi:hydrogenase small subunit
MYLGFSRVSRRQVLKFIAYLAFVLGLEQDAIPRLAQILAESFQKPPVIWVGGAGCGGCSLSWLSSSRAGVAELILNNISLRWQPLLSQGFTEKKNFLDILEEEVDFFLIVEGALAAHEDEFSHTVRKLALKASAVIAAGACASSGGILAHLGNGYKGVEDFGVGKRTIRLSTCPVHPEHILAVLSYLLYYGRHPELDAAGRPVFLFNASVHENCPRRGSFEGGKFLTDYNNSEEASYCLFLQGCKGIVANADCALRLWNDRENWCVGSNGGCQACSERDFLTRFGPLRAYGSPPLRVSDKAASFLLGAAAGAAGALGASKLVKKMQGSKTMIEKGDNEENHS